MLNQPTPSQLAAMEQRKSFRATIAARAAPQRPESAAKPAGIKGWEVPDRPSIPTSPMKITFDTAAAFTIPEHPINRIIRIVAPRYYVTPFDIRSDRRTKDVVMPRQISMWLARYTTKYSLPEIGRRFGGRDHTTVMHAVRKIDRMMVADPAFAEEVHCLRDLLRQDSA